MGKPARLAGMANATLAGQPKLDARSRRGQPLATVGGQEAWNSVDLEAVLESDFTTLRAALTSKGVPASAGTTPVFVDFDGGGFRAPSRSVREGSRTAPRAAVLSKDSGTHG